MSPAACHSCVCKVCLYKSVSGAEAGWVAEHTTLNAPRLLLYFKVEIAIGLSVQCPNLCRLRGFSGTWKHKFSPETSLQDVHFPLAAIVNHKGRHFVFMFCMPSPYS